MPKLRPANEFPLPRSTNVSHPGAAAVRDGFECAEVIRQELGLTPLGLRVALYLLESRDHAVDVGRIQVDRGNAAQALGPLAYNTVFCRQVEHHGGRGNRTTYLELTEWGRARLTSWLGMK